MADNYGVTIRGLDSLIDGFKKARTDLPEEFGRAMVAATIEVKQEAQSLVPVKTGALRQSIHESVSYSPLIGRVMVGERYGKDVEFGTRARTITPVRASALAFRSGGSMVFTKSVNHPGTRAQPFLGPALQSRTSIIQGYFLRAAQIVLGRIKGV